MRPRDRLISVSYRCFPISVGAGLVSIEGMNVLIKSHPGVGFNYFFKIFHTQAFRSTAFFPKYRVHPVSSSLLGAYRQANLGHVVLSSLLTSFSAFRCHRPSFFIMSSVNLCLSVMLQIRNSQIHFNPVRLPITVPTTTFHLHSS